MNDNKTLPAAIQDNLPQLVAMLEAESSGQAASSIMKNHEEADLQSLWNRFRGLVNRRPPLPISEEFLNLQDQMLQAIIAWRGITDGNAIEFPARDPRLGLWQGDITTLAVDAIVNAANNQMLGCFIPGHHCIDNAIHTFAGVQLRLACAQLMDAQGHPELTGHAKITSAFNLPSRFIIHTVGPVATGHPNQQEKALLARCYESCLAAADQNRCQSIAFCCISTGVFGFPQKEAASIAVKTAQDWLGNNPDTPIKRVIFNVFSDKDYDYYDGLLR